MIKWTIKSKRKKRTSNNLTDSVDESMRIRSLNIIPKRRSDNTKCSISELGLVRDQTTVWKF